MAAGKLLVQMFMQATSPEVWKLGRKTSRVRNKAAAHARPNRQPEKGGGTEMNLFAANGRTWFSNMGWSNSGLFAGSESEPETAGMKGATVGVYIFSMFQCISSVF